MSTIVNFITKYCSIKFNDKWVFVSINTNDGKFTGNNSAATGYLKNNVVN